MMSVRSIGNRGMRELFDVKKKLAIMWYQLLELFLAWYFLSNR